MYLLPLLIALQSSPSMCDELSGNAKQLCITGYSEAGQAASSEVGNDGDNQPLTNESQATDDSAEAGAETAAEGAEAAEAGAEAAAATGEAAAEAGYEAAQEAELEMLVNQYRNSWQLVSVGSTNAHWLVKGINLSSVTNISKPIWIKSDYSRDKTTEARTAMSLMQFDCQNRKTKNLARTAYDPDGSVIFSKEYPYSSWEYTVPDSVLDSVLDSICID